MDTVQTREVEFKVKKGWNLIFRSNDLLTLASDGGKRVDGRQREIGRRFEDWLGVADGSETGGAILLRGTGLRCSESFGRRWDGAWRKGRLANVCLGVIRYGRT